MHSFQSNEMNDRQQMLCICNMAMTSSPICVLKGDYRAILMTEYLEVGHVQTLQGNLGSSCLHILKICKQPPNLFFSVHSLHQKSPER